MSDDLKHSVMVHHKFIFYFSDYLIHYFPNKWTNFAFFLGASKTIMGTGINFLFQDFKCQTLELLLVMNALNIYDIYIGNNKDRSNLCKIMVPCYATQVSVWGKSPKYVMRS